MKKIILSILIIGSISMNAQDKGAPSESQVGLGIRYGIGINSASVSEGTNPTTSIMTPLNAALIAEIKLHKIFAIQPELAITQKGFSSPSGSSTLDAIFTYLGFNVLPKLKLGNDQLEGFLMVGPGINFKISAKASFNGRSEDISDVNELDLSGIFGVGGAYKLSSGKIFIDARYNMPFIKANTDNSGPIEIKLNQIGVNAGYIHNF